jgi:hypothetical protein
LCVCYGVYFHPRKEKLSKHCFQVNEKVASYYEYKRWPHTLSMSGTRQQSIALLTPLIAVMFTQTTSSSMPQQQQIRATAEATAIATGVIASTVAAITVAAVAPEATAAS